MIQAALHIVAALLTCLLLGQPSPAILVAASLLAILPDIDTPRSLIGRLAQPLSIQIERRVGHRTATHSLIALAVVSGAAFALAPAHWPALSAAYASHIIIDLIIGRQGVAIFWPHREQLTIFGLRDDGPAPRVLLLMLLPCMLLAALWPQLGPAISPSITAAAQAANPISTATPTPTQQPSIRLSFELPQGVGLSALRVRQGDAIREGQVLAGWAAATATPQPTATPPPTQAPPAALPIAPLSQVSQQGAAEAQAALDALDTAHAAERAAVLAEQQRKLAEAQRRDEEARRTLGQLQNIHEREQQEAEHSVQAALAELGDASAASMLADKTKPEDLQRASERIHRAEEKLREQVDARDRMRTRQGIERADLEAAAQAAADDLAALPEAHRADLAKRDADHAAARGLAQARLGAAQASAADALAQHGHTQAIADATATAQAQQWHAVQSATAQAHHAAATATAQAAPTPQPAQVRSRAAGTIIAITAAESGGTLVVTLEVGP